MKLSRNYKLFETFWHFLSRHEVLRSEEAQERLGSERLGCFEIPKEDEEPSSGPDIPECSTLNKQVVSSQSRCFIMGHRLQFKAGVYIVYT